MSKYKFKLKQTVFPLSAKRIYTKGSKHHQKWEGVVISRFQDTANQRNTYVIKTVEGAIKYAYEEALTSSREKKLCYLVIEDADKVTKHDVLPDVLPENFKTIELWGVEHD